MKPGEHKTVQSRILGYAEAIGWTVVSREVAELRRGFDPEVPRADRAKSRSLFFDDLLVPAHHLLGAHEARLRQRDPLVVVHRHQAIALQAREHPGNRRLLG